MSSTTDQAVTSRPSESNTVARPMRKDAARNRELLLASARVVFAQRGADASLDDIARHAGLGVGTAYRHFGNKYELLDALMVQLVDHFILTAEHSLDVEDPWQAIVVFLEGALEVQVNDRGLREVMLGFHESAKFDEINDRIGALLDKLLERARRSGQVREDVVASDLGVIISMLCAAADLTSEHAPQLWRRYLALCLDGLRPAGAALPQHALDQAQFRTAMRRQKQSISRTC